MAVKRLISYFSTVSQISVDLYVSSLMFCAGNRTCSDPDLMYQCSNNRCIYKRWMCDGEDDCRNGEDEVQEKCNSECRALDNDLDQM